LTGWGLQLPGDDAEQARAQREIQGHYKPLQTPRFSWEQTSYRGGYGNARYALARGAAPAEPGAMPPPAPMAQAVGGAMAMKRGRVAAGEEADSRNADRDADGIA